MPKVIEHGDMHTKITPRTLVCPVCNCKFEYMPNETERTEVTGEEFIRCPECHALCFTGGYDMDDTDQLFTMDNPPHYPQDFYVFKNPNSGVSDADINKWIEDMMQFFKRNPNEDMQVTATGNAVVIAMRFEDGIHIYVARDYYAADVD